MHQAITWTNVDLSSVESCTIHLKSIALEKLKKVITTMYLKIAHLKSKSGPPGDNGLKNMGNWIIAHLTTNDIYKQNICVCHFTRYIITNQDPAYNTYDCVRYTITICLEKKIEKHLILISRFRPLRTALVIQISQYWQIWKFLINGPFDDLLMDDGDDLEEWPWGKPLNRECLLISKVNK